MLIVFVSLVRCDGHAGKMASQAPHMQKVSLALIGGTVTLCSAGATIWHGDMSTAVLTIPSLIVSRINATRTIATVIIIYETLANGVSNVKRLCHSKHSHLTPLCLISVLYTLQF